MKIEIGGGTNVEEGWINLDPVHGVGEFKRLAQDGIPCDDNTVSHVRASHVLEHIPAGAERIAVFNEVHRVLWQAGTFEVMVPLVGSWRAFADPTHVSFWCLKSFGYFDGTITAGADYGIARWHTLALEARGDETDPAWEAHWVGMKP